MPCHAPCTHPWSRFAVHCPSSGTLCCSTVFQRFQKNRYRNSLALSRHRSEVQVGSLSQLLRMHFSRHCFRNAPKCVQDKTVCHVPCGRPWSQFAVHCPSSETLCFSTVFERFQKNRYRNYPALSRHRSEVLAPDDMS